MSADKKKANQDTQPLESLDPILPEEEQSGTSAKKGKAGLTEDETQLLPNLAEEDGAEDDLTEEAPDEEAEGERPPFFTSKQKKVLVVVFVAVMLLAVILGIAFNRHVRDRFSQDKDTHSRISSTDTSEESSTTPEVCPNGHPYENGASCGCPICIQEYGKDSNCTLVAEYADISVICPICHYTQHFQKTIVKQEKCTRCGVIIENKEPNKEYDVSCQKCNTPLKISLNSNGLQNSSAKINEVYWPSQEVYDVTYSAKTVTYRGTTYFYYPSKTVSLPAICTCGNTLGSGNYHALYLYNADRLTSVSGGSTPYYNAATGQFYQRSGKWEAVLDANGNVLRSFDHSSCAASSTQPAA